MTQTELVERWRINEATLKRWRTESNGPMPVFLKFGNQVRYRTQDVEDFEEVALGGATTIDGGVGPITPASRSSPQLPQSATPPLRPITI